jgi:peptide deformylase
MIYPIVAYGDPVLREECREIEENDSTLPQLIEDMFETMYQAEGVGLAAPQIGKALRLFIVDASPFKDEEPELEHFKKVFINPEMIEETGKEWGFVEGCLSIPGIRENVNRKPEITINYLDENFEEHEETFTGIAARVIQHEYDHIEGILFTDKINPLKKQMIKRKLNNILKGEVRADYKMKFPKASKK